ncbi:MAG: hypothetical protein GKR92_09940 [Gammaproteobacteria bacterium]|nr:MAG: hypothetical protein GKR92_09940 [Gammaproteobacteria bacterium]
MKKLHISISTDKLDESIKDYSERLGQQPCSLVNNEYALWRTEALNVSIRRDKDSSPGLLRHLGWEDDSALEFSSEIDVNGIIWERFNAKHQADEINELWPQANYRIK